MPLQQTALGSYDYETERVRVRSFHSLTQSEAILMTGVLKTYNRLRKDCTQQ